MKLTKVNDIEGIIFDLDGTLIDSMWVWGEINEEFLGKRNLAWDASMYQKDMEGMSFTETAKYFKNVFNLEDSVEDIKREWIEMTHDSYSSRVELKKGVMEFLNKLAESNVPMGIATSNSIELVDAVLNRYKIKNYFKCIVTGCEVKRGKPFPDVFIQASKLLGVEASKCLAFEDVPAGVKAAKAAGMRVTAVEDYYSKEFKDDLKGLADFYINDYCSIDLISSGDNSIALSFKAI